MCVWVHVVCICVCVCVCVCGGGGGGRGEGGWQHFSKTELDHNYSHSIVKNFGIGLNDVR